jgi:hypothetical protein
VWRSIGIGSSIRRRGLTVAGRFLRRRREPHGRRFRPHSHRSTRQPAKGALQNPEIWPQSQR